eukprot:CAMPEP_0118656532 /NCGR_PEP_ID=MMETSP0785-20121206/13538_1 /TAXON_ID=91992 /ORGANISM="Bolidomonas pacifica, Strain CCMP 1866" /LENGTH=311 /DNA_ID=CAMNT_0006549395 /DNA_START=197 /DNA_END=1128 /DNA_ORIENTATION=-
MPTVQESISNLLSNLHSPTLTTQWSNLTQSSPPQTLRSISVSTLTAMHDQNAIEAVKDMDMDNVQVLVDIVKNVGTHNFNHAEDNILRRTLYQYYLDNSSFSTAAEILSTLRILPPSPPTPYSFTPSQTLDVYVTVAECYLEDDDPVSAEVWVGKAAGTVSSVEGLTTEVLRFKSTQARVLDAQRKFLQASSFYHMLSLTSHPSIHPPDLLLLLTKACTTCVLAKAGQRRTKMLTQLALDERLPSLTTSSPTGSSVSDIVLAMYRGEIVDIDDTKEFESTLEEHQRARLSDGRTILSRSVQEHNVLALSRV